MEDYEDVIDMLSASESSTTTTTTAPSDTVSPQLVLIGGIVLIAIVGVIIWKLA